MMETESSGTGDECLGEAWSVGGKVSGGRASGQRLASREKPLWGLVSLA